MSGQPQPIRLAVAALSRRIYAGRPAKDGRSFKEPRYDVTSDALKAIVEHIGVNHEASVTVDGKPAYVIRVTEASKEDALSLANPEEGQP